MSKEPPAGTSPEALQVPFSRISTFVRQVTHDVRNNLNSMDLQAAYICELVEDAELLAEVKRLRGLVQSSARQLQSLSANFQSSAPSFVTYEAAILVEDLRDRVNKIFPETAGQVSWEIDLAGKSVEVDVEMLFGALIELLRNALQFRKEGEPLSFYAGTEDGQAILEIRERKDPPVESPELWGTEPFVSSRRSGYGLGLFRARRAIKLQGGTLEILYDSAGALLRSRVSLPLAHPQ